MEMVLVQNLGQNSGQISSHFWSAQTPDLRGLGPVSLGPVSLGPANRSPASKTGQKEKIRDATETQEQEKLAETKEMEK